MAEPLTYEQIREACYQRFEGDDGDERFDAWLEGVHREVLFAHFLVVTWDWVAKMMSISFEHRHPAANVATRHGELFGGEPGEPCQRCGSASPCDARLAADAALLSHGFPPPRGVAHG